MGAEGGAQVVCRYEIHIKGRLAVALLAAFEGLTVTVQPVQTVLSGELADQASLYELLQRVQSLGWNWSRSAA
jgi:hypothetical protein